MPNVPWQVSGDYFESCNCDFLCPCITSNLTAQPTQGHCDAALVFHIERGHYGDQRLDGLSFAVFLHSPGKMADGNITVGVITDARASAEQQQALVAIASGQAGGPMAALGPLVGAVAGVEARPIEYQRNGMQRRVTIEGTLDQAVEGIGGGNGTDPLYIDNTVHPASPRLALARATHAHMHAFGIHYDSAQGGNNGHFAPSTWRG
jgi:hypothetical protein